MKKKKLVYSVRLSQEEKAVLMEALIIAKLDARGRKMTWASAAACCEEEQRSLCKTLEKSAARDHDRYEAVYGKLLDAAAEME